MKVYKLKDMKDGWFIGAFEPAAYCTDKFEVAWKVHRKDEDWPMHYQKEATEINLLVRGEMFIRHENGEVTLVRPGDIFIFEPGVKAKPIFWQDCEVLCVKTPSLPKDKVVVCK